eukprot:1156329-Pelagomonas_calceolata.AAC.9
MESTSRTCSRCAEASSCNFLLLELVVVRMCTWMHLHVKTSRRLHASFEAFKATTLKHLLLAMCETISTTDCGSVLASSQGVCAGGNVTHPTLHDQAPIILLKIITTVKINLVVSYCATIRYRSTTVKSAVKPSSQTKVQ